MRWRESTKFLFDFASCNFFRIQQRKKTQKPFSGSKSDFGAAPKSEICVDYNNALFNKFLSTFFTCAFVGTTFEIAPSRTHESEFNVIITIVVLLKGAGVEREMENLRNKCDHLNSYKDSLNIYKELQRFWSLFSSYS